MKFTFKFKRGLTGTSVTVKCDGKVVLVRRGTLADTREELTAEARVDAEAYGYVDGI
jgi:hypothetical protein